jgi:hypothetical protein
MQQIAERAGPNDLLQDLMLDAVDLRATKSEYRFAVAPCHALEKLGPGSHVFPELRRGQRVERVSKHEVGGV